MASTHDTLASTSWVLRFQACAIIPGLYITLNPGSNSWEAHYQMSYIPSLQNLFFLHILKLPLPQTNNSWDSKFDYVQYYFSMMETFFLGLRGASAWQLIGSQVKILLLGVPFLLYLVFHWIVTKACVCVCVYLADVQCFHPERHLQNPLILEIMGLSFL